MNLCVRRLLPASLALLSLAAVVAPVAGMAPAGAVVHEAPLCSLRQMSSGGSGVSSQDPVISADGSALIYSSDQEKDDGPAPPNQELFAVDIDEGGVTQLTDTDEGFNLQATVSGDGEHVAWVTTSDINSENTDENAEIWHGRRDASGAFNPFTVEPLTVTTGLGPLANGLPYLNEAGDELAFVSTREVIIGDTNGSVDLYAMSTSPSTIRRITDGTGLAAGSFDGLGGIDDDGNVLLTSVRDLDELSPSSANADLNREVFVAQPDDGDAGTVPEFLQLTDTTGSHVVDANMSNGRSGDVAIASDANLLSPGDNADDASKVFLFSRTNLDFEEVVSAFSVGGASTAPAVAGEQNTRVAFASSSDLTGSDGNATSQDGSTELYLDVPEPRFSKSTVTTQVTDAPSGSVSAPSISRDGTRIAFTSSLDLVGENSNLVPVVYVAFCGSGLTTFGDVGQAHTFFDEIAWMAAAGVTRGFLPGPTYRPGQAVTRQSLSAFMFRLAGSPPFEAPGTATFGDVPVTSTFFREIEWMADVGVTTGFPGGQFRPGEPVTRQSMSAFMFRLAGSPPFSPPTTPTFSDVPASSTFFDEIEWMAAEEITTGFQPGPIFKPSQAVTRQSMSAFMFRLAAGPGVDVGD
jgi:Tol biopolymer transport system component